MTTEEENVMSENNMSEDNLLNIEESNTSFINIGNIYNKNNITELLSNTSCIDKPNKCNYKNPYSKISFYGRNPITNKKYSEEDRNYKVNEYINSCNTKKNTSVELCCNKDDTNLKKLINSNKIIYKEFNNFTKFYPYIKINKKQNKTKSIDICRNNGPKCIQEGYKRPSQYEICKLLKNNDISRNLYQNIDKSNLYPDCTNFNCEDNIDLKTSSYLLDIYLYNAIKIDNSDELKNIISNNNKILNEILKYPNNNPLIHETIINKSNKCFRLLLGFNPDLNVIDYYGNTPLHISCLTGNELMTFMLIKQGADTTSQNKYGDTPLHCAAMSSNEKLLLILFNSNSSIHILNEKDETPLFSAVKCKNKNLKIVSLLVNKGSDLRLRNKNNDSLLNILNRDEKTSTNLEIDTFIKKKYYDSCKNNDEYDKLKTDFPEIKNYTFDSPNEENVDVYVEYDDTNNQEKYYLNKEFPIKKNFKEGFTNNSCNYIKYIIVFIIFLFAILKYIY